MIDALVVGAGPVGLTMAMLLKKQGLDLRIVERRPGPQRSPAAHVINARTFEIWRQLGLNVEKIRQQAQDPHDAGRVFWVDSLGGRVFGSLPYEQQGDDQLTNTPTPLRNLSQHILEPLLRDEAQRMGIKIEYGHEWIAANDDSDAEWILACDGASSSVRQWAGIDMIGPDNLQRFLAIHFRADLSQAIGHNRGVLYWICGSAGGTFISHGNGGEWVYMSPYSDGDDQLGNAAAIVRINSALAQENTTIEILSKSTWTMTSQIAATYQTANIFLVGDAAHRFPPSGGMGLNTGIGDAHNLAWKIGSVQRGQAAHDVLSTYEAERRPIAERNAQASLENAFRMLEVFEAISKSDEAEISLAITHQATHFDMLGLQIGYRYRLDDSDPELELLSEEVIRQYQSAALRGKRLAHGWLKKDGRIVSSLDLVPSTHSISIGGPTSPLGETDVRLGLDLEDPHNWWGTTLGLASHQVLTIRPDQHSARVE